MENLENLTKAIQQYIEDTKAYGSSSESLKALQRTFKSNNITIQDWNLLLDIVGSISDLGNVSIIDILNDIKNCLSECELSANKINEISKDLDEGSQVKYPTEHAVQRYVGTIVDTLDKKYASKTELDTKSTVTPVSDKVEGASSIKSINIDGTIYNLYDGNVKKVNGVDPNEQGDVILHANNIALKDEDKTIEDKFVEQDGKIEGAIETAEGKSRAVVLSVNWNFDTITSTGGKLIDAITGDDITSQIGTGTYLNSNVVNSAFNSTKNDIHIYDEPPKYKYIIFQDKSNTQAPVGWWYFKVIEVGSFYKLFNLGDIVIIYEEEPFDRWVSYAGNTTVIFSKYTTLDPTLYYKKTEIDTKLNGYYKKTETDTKLNEYSKATNIENAGTYGVRLKGSLSSVKGTRNAVFGTQNTIENEESQASLITGYNNKATGKLQFAVVAGYSNTIGTGNGAIIAGTSLNISDAYLSIVSGQGHTGKARLSVVEGNGHSVYADYAAVFGFKNTVGSEDNVLFQTIVGGDSNNIQRHFTFAYGWELVASKMTADNIPHKVIFGSFNKENNEAIFEIGNGTDDEHRSNAFEVYEDGHAEVQVMGETDSSIATKKYVDEHRTDTSDKMDKVNPTGTGSFSLNRAARTTIGINSFAEGSNGTASGDNSHVEGDSCFALNKSSHAEGYSTKAQGIYSHTEGVGTTTNNNSEHASGRYNVSHKVSETFGNAGNTLFSIGNGSNGNPKNAFEVFQDGHVAIQNGLEIAANGLKIGNTIITETQLKALLELLK